MFTYTSFAIWGAGNQGGRLARALLAKPSVASVTILTRPGSVNKDSNRELAALGAKVVPFDVHSPDASSALQGIEVLISTAPSAGIPLQPLLITAAAQEGVKLFVPAEWSMDGERRGTFVDAIKLSVRQAAKDVGLPTAIFFPGQWVEWLTWMGWDLKNGRIMIPGDGTGLVSMTGIEDATEFAAHVLTSLKPEELKDRKFYYEADRTTLYDLAQALQKASAKPLEITRTGRASLEEKIAANPKDLMSLFALAWDDGKGAHASALSNDLVPGWKPRSAVEILTGMLPQ